MLTPFLRVIDLSSNLLSDATGFTECHFNHLENINLENNRFAEINSLVKLESQLLRLKADISMSLISSQQLDPQYTEICAKGREKSSHILLYQALHGYLLLSRAVLFNILIDY